MSQYRIILEVLQLLSGAETTQYNVMKRTPVNFHQKKKNTMHKAPAETLHPQTATSTFIFLVYSDQHHE